MSVVPRFVLTRFPTKTASRFTQWNDHLARVTGVASTVLATANDDDNVFVWSLTSANNRELARGWHAYTRFDAATAATAELAEFAGSLDPQYINDPHAGGLGWFLSLGGVPEVVCSRWYDSDRDRRAALQGTLNALPIAVSAPGARTAAAGRSGVSA